MKKITVILIMTMLIITSCSQKNIIDNDRKTVNVWYYKNTNNRSQLEETVTDLMTDYGSANGIEVIVNEFKESELSYDDYVLKRNLALGSGNVDITMDYSNDLYSLKDKCGDYTRIDGYESIWDGMKNRYCILMYLNDYVYVINGQVFDEYNVNCNDVITEDEYYELKWKLRDKGAVFELNMLELGEIINEHVRSMKNVIMEENGGYHVDEKNFNEVLDRAYEAVKLSKGSVHEVWKNGESLEQVIRDSVSGIELNSVQVPYCTAHDYSKLRGIGIDNSYENFPDKPVYLLKDINDTVGLFISSEAPQAAYDVASVIFTEKYYGTIKNYFWCGPIVNKQWARDRLMADENWEYAGKISDTIYGLSGDSLKKVFDLCYERVLTDNHIFDNQFEDLVVRARYRDFLDDCLGRMEKKEGRIDDLAERIKNFETNLNVR